MTIDKATDSARRVLIVDDHPVMRRGIHEALSHEPSLQVCGEAGDVPQAMRLVESLRPDLMTVDISLDGSSGLDLIKRVHAMYPDIRMLVVSMHDEVFFADRALAAGAMGYVSKHEASEKLVEAVRFVLLGGVYLSPEMTARMLRKGPRAGPESISPVQKLSDRELEVFEAIGRGHSSSRIAERLRISVKTIETHRANIKRKLGLADNVQLIQRSSRWVLDRE